MRNKKRKLMIGSLVLAAAALFWGVSLWRGQRGREAFKEIKPEKGAVQNVISTTGTVLPKNRLEVKPPVNGRVEEVVVREGEMVKTGQILAWMSSTERAALLDAARGQGEEALKYWQEVYKAIPLISPIDGEVIVAKTQPGQAVTTADAVVVLSDALIVRAQVDETDIGKIKKGLAAVIALDAYPEEEIKAHAEHIYYESKTVNNVTIYEVDLLPDEVPSFFRSGMNATVDFIEKSKEGVLLIPLEAVQKEEDEAFVLVREKAGQEPVERKVKLGLSDDKNVEVVSGLDAGDTLLVKSKKYVLPKSETGRNPFMIQRQRSTSRSSRETQ